MPVWMSDTSGAGFRVKGYTLDEQDRPVFNYIIYGKKVTDAIQVACWIIPVFKGK